MELNSGGTAALELAKKEASKLYNKYAGTEHLLLGILILKDRSISSIFRKMNIDTSDIQQVIYDNVYQKPNVDGLDTSTVQFTPRVQKMLASGV